MATRFIHKVSTAAEITDLLSAAGISVLAGNLVYHDGTTTRTLATLDGVQSLSNKTIPSGVLTAPTITTPSGVVTVLEALITQTAGDGTYTASFALPAGATLLDIFVTAVVTWNAGTSAALNIGINGGDSDCFFAAVNLNSPTIAAGKTIRFAFPGGVGGASIPAIDVGGEGGAAASSAVFLGATNGLLYNATAKTIDAVVAQVGNGTNGRTRVTIVYALPASVGAAVKV